MCKRSWSTAANGVNISGGIVAEFGRIARTDGLNTVTPGHMWCWDNVSDIDKGKKSYPCRYPAVMNWVMLCVCRLSSAQ